MPLHIIPETLNYMTSHYLLIPAYCLCSEISPIFNELQEDTNSTLFLTFSAGSAEPGFEPQSSQYGYDAKSWRPSVTSTTGKTIKAEFSIPVCVTAIQSWGNPHTGDYTISYQLYYDDVHGLSDAEYEDGVRRQGNSRKIEGNSDSVNGVLHTLPPKWLTSLSAKLRKYSGHRDWRWELYGCARLADDDVVTPLVVMRSMRSALWDVPPLMNALDLDKETAEATLLLSDDDNSTCLDPPDSCDAWHALIRIPLFPGITPLRIVGHGIQCDFRHVLVTHQQTVTSSRLASRVCRLVSNADCEAHCTDDDQDLRDMAVYVRAGAGAALCQITAHSLINVV
ncbi:hypothetical protein CAPTEDRAFT_215500 [Capitella teleta]|uniref:F5/8 type C domain-containing protein n=1 Tax=Capitella teleta TaxID=283909 RepID=R7VFY2_CAPTE|nr:hypothetical protein CAPTEDRAFT_215500 [Capitella teleta]|eukprot:ELU15186.1 hypothetical protein CAPTEDRAFT_215500 [Capitella teleta]